MAASRYIPLLLLCCAGWARAQTEWMARYQPHRWDRWTVEFEQHWNGAVLIAQQADQPVEGTLQARLRGERLAGEGERVVVRFTVEQLALSEQVGGATAPWATLGAAELGAATAAATLTLTPTGMEPAASAAEEGAERALVAWARAAVPPLPDAPAAAGASWTTTAAGTPCAWEWLAVEPDGVATAQFRCANGGVEHSEGEVRLDLAAGRPLEVKRLSRVTAPMMYDQMAPTGMALTATRERRLTVRTRAQVRFDDD